VNGYTFTLLNNNPNLNPANGSGATNPFRLDRSQAVTRDQSHGYTAEQQAFNSGVMDLFPLFVGRAGPPPSGGGITSTTGLNLGYFDGNTVTTLWYLAQYFAMNDNSYSTGFGPSTPGALNLISGQTNGATATTAASFAIVAGGAGSYGRVQPGHYEPKWHNRLCQEYAGAFRNHGGLHSSPQLVPVLQLHRESRPHKARFNC